MPNVPATAPNEKRFAVSVLTIKAMDELTGVIRGTATTPSADRMGDVVEPKGAQFKLPIPLLWQHKSDKPIGFVTKATVTKNGIDIEAKIERDVPVDYVREAWELIKAGLVRCLSIGFAPLETSFNEETGGFRFLRWDWLELSAVTIPANAEATISTVKSFDRQLRSGASAARPVVRLTPAVDTSPGVPGTNAAPTQTIPQRNTMTTKTMQEQIAAFETLQKAAQDKADAVMKKSLDEGRSMDEAEVEDYDTAMREVDTIEAQLKRMRAHEARVVRSTGTAVAVAAQGMSPDQQIAARAGITVRGAEGQRTGAVAPIFMRGHDLPKGTGFARYAMALAHSKGNLMQAAEIAKRWDDSTPEVGIVLRAAVAAGNTTDATWAGPLVEYQTLASEFMDILRPATILGKMDGVRRVPFNIRVASKTQGSTVGWVGQGAPKPVSALAFNATTLGFAKAAGIVVITQELARFSSPAAEQLIRDDLRDTMVQFLDEQFINPAIAAVADVSPASITNGATKVTSAGATLANIQTDVTAVFTSFINNDLAPARGVWIMNPMMAMKLSLLRTSQDVFAFPQINLGGGTFFGLPVIVSDSVPSSVSGGSIIVLVDQSEIFVADDGGIAIDVSEQASLQMSSTPSAGATSLVSLWQNNLVGIRAERFINWAKRRNAAVVYIDAVNY